MSNDTNVYGIPTSELSNDPVRVKNGTYYNFKGYNLYVPDEVDSTTSAFIYYPGSGGSGNDAKIINNIIESGSANQIIVVADDAYRDRTTGGERHLQLIENIGSVNGVEISNIDTMGFSAGGPSTYNTLLNTITKYPDSGPHNAVFCDIVDLAVTQEQIDLLVKDEATLLFLEPYNHTHNFEKKLAEGGVDIIIARTNGNHAGHVALNTEALQNGIIDFITGETDTLANSDIYTFMVYDSTTGEYKNITLEEVAEKFSASMNTTDPMYLYQKLSNITELRSDNEYLASKVNNIRSAIRNTNFLSSSCSDSYGSTTKVPSSLGTLVQSYFGVCSNMLNKIEIDTRKIIDIGESIDELNANLEKESEDLNQSVDLYANMNNGNVTNSYVDKNDAGNSSNTGDDKTTSVNNNVTNNTTEDKNNSSNATNTSNNSVNSDNANNSNINNSTSNNNSGLNDNSNGNNSNYVGSSNNSSNNISSNLGNNEVVNTEVSEQILKLEKEFLNYEDLYTNYKMLVYDYNDAGDSCKMVIHYEDNKVTGLEYYYDFKTEDLAKRNVELLTDDLDGYYKIIQNEEYVKVIFNDSIYKGLTIDDVKKSCKDLEMLMKEAG